MVRLNPRQLKVLRELAQGKSNRKIAEALGTSEQAVKNVLYQMYELTGMGNRLELLLWFQLHTEDYEPDTPTQTD